RLRPFPVCREAATISGTPGRADRDRGRAMKPATQRFPQRQPMRRVLASISNTMEMEIGDVTTLALMLSDSVMICQWAKLFTQLMRSRMTICSGVSNGSAALATIRAFPASPRSMFVWRSSPKARRTRSAHERVPLLASLQKYLSNETRRASRFKRGRQAEFVCLDLESAEDRYGLEPIENLTPEKVFDARW